MAVLSSSFLTVLTIFSSSTVAQNWYNNYNASGSITTPGFRVNDSYPASTWTWSRYVTSSLIAGNKSSVMQGIGLNFDPVFNLSDPSTPYTGCVIVPLGTDVTSSKAEHDDGSCSSIINSKCLTAVQSGLQQGASQQSGRTFTGGSDLCSQILTSITGDGGACENLWEGFASSTFLPTNFTGPTQNVSHQDVEGNVTNPLLGFGADYATASDNFTVYDKYIRIPQPVFAAVWLKPTSNSSSYSYSTDPAQQPWSDSRVMCITANNTTPGSRNITEADKAATGGASRAEMSLFGVVGLALFALLVL